MLARIQLRHTLPREHWRRAPAHTRRRRCWLQWTATTTATAATSSRPTGDCHAVMHSDTQQTREQHPTLRPSTTSNATESDTHPCCPTAMPVAGHPWPWSPLALSPESPHWQAVAPCRCPCVACAPLGVCVCCWRINTCTSNKKEKG